MEIEAQARRLVNQGVSESRYQRILSARDNARGKAGYAYRDESNANGRTESVFKWNKQPSNKNTPRKGFVIRDGKMVPFQWDPNNRNRGWHEVTQARGAKG